MSNDTLRAIRLVFLALPPKERPAFLRGLSATFPDKGD